jgi:hypothetical protein
MGPSHAAEARRTGTRAIGALKLREDGGVVHLAMIATLRPPGKCRAAHLKGTWVLVGYQYPREKKPSSASTRTTIRMIQRMLML